jgi:hypothetical protein
VDTLKEEYISIVECDFDFIVFDFLYGIDPEPEMFELKQVLAIPPKDMESDMN